MATSDPCFDRIKNLGLSLSDQKIKDLLGWLDKNRDNPNLSAELNQRIESDRLEVESKKKGFAVRMQRLSDLHDFAKDSPSAFHKIKALIDRTSKSFGDAWNGAYNHASTTRAQAFIKVYSNLLDTLGIKNTHLFQKLIKDPAFNLDVARELGGKTTGNDSAKAVADLIRKHWDGLITKANNAGAYITKLPYYIMAQSHDAYKIQQMGEEAWKNLIRPLVTEESYMRPDGTVADPEEFLHEAYLNITEGRSTPSIDPWENIPDTVRGMARGVSSHRLFVFKSPEDFLAYNEKAGSHGNNIVWGNLKQMMNLAYKTGIMERMSGNPEQYLKQAIEQVKKEFRGTDGKLTAKQERAIWDRYRLLTGEANQFGASKLARRATNVRRFLNLVHLGLSAFTSQSDEANLATLVMGVGAGPAKAVKTMFEGWMGSNKAIFSLGMSHPFNDLEKRALIKSTGIGANAFMHATATRFGEIDAPGLWAEAENAFFKINGLAGHDDATQFAAAHAFMSIAHDFSGKAWGDLNKGYRKVLEYSGINEADWNAIRKSPATDFKGGKIISPEDVKGDAAQKFRMHLTAIAQHAVPLPDVETRALMGFGKEGMQPDTFMGQALRSVMMYKAFPMGIATKMIPYAIHGGPTTIATYVSTMAAFGYIAMSAKNALSGKYPPDPTDWHTWADAAAQSGAASFLGDMIFRDFSYTTPAEYAAGPLAGPIDQLFRLKSEIVDGKATPGQYVRFMQSNLLPFGNLPITRMAVKYLMTDPLMEAASPGSIAQERRQAAQWGEKYFIQ